MQNHFHKKESKENDYSSLKVRIFDGESELADLNLKHARHISKEHMTKHMSQSPHERNGSNKEPSNRNRMEPEAVEPVSQTEPVEPEPAEL